MNESDSIKEFRDWLVGESIKAERRYLQASVDMREKVGTTGFVVAMDQFQEGLQRHTDVRNVVNLMAEWREVTGGKA